jgi:anti-sigma regulatory factor (Ser/Thr protein kinase)
MHAVYREGRRIERFFAQRDFLAPSAARGALSELDWLDTRTRHDLAMAISELVANAVRHAPIVTGGQVRLVVESSAHGVRVEVHDPGNGFDPTLDPPGLGGRGLAIVAAVAKSWGIEAIDHTLVWCQLASSTHAADASSG